MVRKFKFRGVRRGVFLLCLPLMIAYCCFLLSGLLGSLAGGPDLLCMFWNVENLFEARPHFRDKCNGIAKTIMLAGDEFGEVPDVIGLAEVENRQVVQKMVTRTALRKLDYGIVHYDSPDHRGIDCALLYRRSRFRVLHSKPCHFTDSSGRLLPTRDILLVVLEPKVMSGDIPPEGRATRGTKAGGPSRRDGGVSPEGELPKGEYLPAYGLIRMPHGLSAYGTIEEGLVAAKESGRKVFVDITGHGCVNCREMEARVWSDPQVLQRLKNYFVLVALYTDDKQKLPESSWVVTPDGKTLKDVGRVNSYIARSVFGVNAQPNYFILDADGKILAGPRGYDLSVPGFIDFLDLK